MTSSVGNNWACTRCTFENEMTDDTCAVCGETKSTYSVGNNWRRGMCTLENEMTSGTCEACGATKGATAIERIDAKMSLNFEVSMNADQFFCVGEVAR